MGIGTTATACVRLGVDFIGTEIDENYIEIAKKRIAKRKTELEQVVIEFKKGDKGNGYKHRRSVCPAQRNR